MAARLCHDLSGLAGTLSGCLELAAEDGNAGAIGGANAGAIAGANAGAITLAHEAAEALSARLRLLRAAWTGQCGALDAAGVAQLAAGLAAGQVSVDVRFLTGVLPPLRARLALNLLLLAAEALPRGGVVAVSGSADGTLRVNATGPRITWPASLAADPPEQPRELLAPLCAMLARVAGLELGLEGEPLTLVARALG